MSAATNRQIGDTADANGNILGSVNTSLQNVFDIENRITNPGGTTMKYSYDTGNKRMWRGNTSAGLDEIDFWAGNQKLATYSVSAGGYYGLQFTMTTTRVYFGAKLVSQGYASLYANYRAGYAPPDYVSYNPVAADRLGSIGKFYPYGQERPSATTNDTEKFTGYFRDQATGLDYADQRYHQPGVGRFITPDPLSESIHANDPGTQNRYAYVGGDPVNKIDPTGEYSSTDGGWYDGALGGSFSVGTGDVYCGIECQNQVYWNTISIILGPAAQQQICQALTTAFANDGGAWNSNCGNSPFTNAAYPQPSCSISLWERPVGGPAGRVGAEHTYLYLQGPGVNETIEAGPDFVDYPAGYLVGRISNPIGTNALLGTNPLARNNIQVGGTYTGTLACSDVQAIGAAVSTYDDSANLAIYNPVPELGPGYNSNSFTYTLLRQFGLLSVVGTPGNVPGWGFSVPGL